MLTDFLLNYGYDFFASGWMQLGAAFGVSFLIMLVFGNSFINYMRSWLQHGQPISENVPESHLKKAGTPTMGGLLLLISIIISSILFMKWSNPTGWIALMSLVMFGVIGFFDDYKKVRSQSKKAANGLSPKVRLILELLCVLVLAYFINKTMPPYIPEFSVSLPFGIILPLGLFYFIFAYFVITGSANATNITDGLDGMLSKIYMPVLIVLVVALYGATRIGFMDSVMFLPQANGLYPVLGAAFGAVMGFLWFNSKPAAIFMGDVGSLALGGFMGTVAMLLKSEIIMGIAAGMMVLILMSSFIQTMYFKITRKITGTGKRVFKMAPLHHHFELKGYSESKIVERFFIVSILFSGLALILLKFA
ncbi:MAG: phospho-N-acetylmuramoyl-pentapeptide-transferase [Alphaproteobacteria bacterium]|nr:phospho-N-acetylmuramoyl-pentapeptide-transferase [Alphaproteobacteria bacterium]MBN2675525.1 phospho-N-acetylmuramoyl-pentapeptide-transferase [Alphaproteobacteria bacterium]